MIDEKQHLCQLLSEMLEDTGCGVSCSDAEIYKEDGEWKLFMEGFMEPWPMGKTVEAFEANLRDYASQGFGLS